MLHLGMGCLRLAPESSQLDVKPANCTRSAIRLLALDNVIVAALWRQASGSGDFIAAYNDLPVVVAIGR
jgi:hypothetical protein